MKLVIHGWEFDIPTPHMSLLLASAYCLQVALIRESEEANDDGKEWEVDYGGMKFVCEVCHYPFGPIYCVVSGMENGLHCMVIADVTCIRYR